MAMDAELKAKWVEALRSGEYKQTQGTLRDGDSFCCLGVLCDITRRGEWIMANSTNRPSLQRFQLGTGQSTMYFPVPLKAELGLSDDLLDPLMDMNDKGSSFKIIADHIEANL